MPVALTRFVRLLQGVAVAVSCRSSTSRPPYRCVVEVAFALQSEGTQCFHVVVVVLLCFIARIGETADDVRSSVTDADQLESRAKVNFLPSI